MVSLVQMFWCSGDLIHVSPWPWDLPPSSQKTCRNSMQKLVCVCKTRHRALGLLDDEAVAMMCCNRHLCGLFYSGAMRKLCCSLPE